MRAHRVAYAYFKGPYDASMFVCHKCDVRLCCRPDHLFLGTARVNSADAARKGRMMTSRGVKNPRAKITREQATDIFASFAAGTPIDEICARFPMLTRTSVCGMRDGKSWRWLAEEIGFEILPKKARRSQSGRPRSQRLSKKDVARFQSKVNVTSGCHLWTGTPNDQGYGVFGWRGRSAGAHQVAFFLHNGRWQHDGYDIAHKCHQRLCVRGDHLEEMSRSDHIRAAVRDGRYSGRRGDNIGNSKLLESDVLEIRSLLAAGSTAVSLAGVYGVTANAIRAIGTGKTWKDVGGPIFKPGQRYVYRKGRRKLDEQAVIDMRLRALTEDACSLAEHYGVTRRSVYQIVSGQSWSSVPLVTAPFDYPLKRYRPGRDTDAERRLVDVVFDHYRGSGYPRSPMPDVLQAVDQVRRSDAIIQEGLLPLSTVGMAAASSYHPHMIDVRCRGKRTPREGYEDDSILRQAILWRIRQGDDLLPYGVAKAIKMTTGVQAASNFRPVVVKALIERFGASFMLDPCAGFGGRILGAAACGIRYVGIDPCTKTVVANRRIIEDIGLKGSTIIQGCCEDVLGCGEWTPDFIFTSPPYFDLEKYSDEPTQSYMRFPTISEWQEGFLRPLIFKSSLILARGGVFALNVSVDMIDVVKWYAESSGMTLMEDLTLPFNKRPYQDKAKTEPVLVFKKLCASL